MTNRLGRSSSDVSAAVWCHWCVVLHWLVDMWGNS